MSFDWKVDAFEPPLPLEWTRHFDDHQREFYYHEKTSTSSFDHPLDNLYGKVWAALAAALDGDPASKAAKIAMTDNKDSKARS